MSLTIGKILQGPLLLALLWLGLPSSIFQSEALENHMHPESNIVDYSPPSYIYDMDGILLMTPEVRHELDSLFYGVR